MSLKQGHAVPRHAKRPPKNPKYDHVRSTLDTGFSMRKFLEKHDENKLNVRFKREENFRRCKASSVAQMILWAEGQLGDDEHDDGAPLEPTPLAERDYLLLDVRDADDFEKTHLVSAVHYPAAMLSRSQNQYITEIFQFKNKEGKIIVLYDDNELVTVNMANLLYEKQFDNIFVLTGGLSKFGLEYPELIVGEPVAPPPRTQRSTTGGGSSSAALTQRRNIPNAAVPQLPTSSRRENMDDNRSVMSSFTARSGKSTARTSRVASNSSFDGGVAHSAPFK